MSAHATRPRPRRRSAPHSGTRWGCRPAPRSASRDPHASPARVQPNHREQTQNRTAAGFGMRFCVCSAAKVALSTVTGAAGIGLATLASDGSVLDTWFPAPELTESGTSATSRLALSDIPAELGALVGRDDDRSTE